MLNNFIGGGQVFLHKVRMLRQVVGTTISVALISGAILAWGFNSNSANENANKVDWDGALTYAKAKLALTVHPVLSAISIGKSKANVDAYSNNRLWKQRMLASSVITSNRFHSAWVNATEVFYSLLLQSIGYGAAAGLLVFLFWSKFGKNLKSEKKNEGSGVVLTATEVNRTLRKLGKAGNFKIGKMSLVKDMETRHFLVTGSTGSGKTNLMHNLLPQVEAKGQPAIVIDQTGEMIAKYYKPERGDIIFNPFDGRGRSWDFWADCGTREDLERFSKILIGFNRKQSGSHSDPFWENAAESVFNACIEHLRPQKASIEEIVKIVCHRNIESLKYTLNNTEASRYLSSDSKQTASSILSVLASNAKPLTYLRRYGESFSMKQHFANIKGGSPAWLFLATKPSSRNLTLPLISCLTELALAQLMDIGIDKDRRVWIVIDELSALGKLPALSSLMAEGRKYGACIIAVMQSLNQLYSHYGQYDGSAIFGQFGTSFFFRNTEPAIAKMVSSMCGTETITRQQKNTSFGANEFRDGVSYNEQQQKKLLVEPEDLANLAIGQCYVLLPEPAVRVVKIQTDEITVSAKHHGFVENEQDLKEEDESIESSEQDQLAIENIADDKEEIDNTEESNEAASKPLAKPLSKNLENETQQERGEFGR